MTSGGGDASAPSSRGGGAAGPWVRPARSGDVDAIARIYGTHVENGTASFEERPPDPEELARRLQAIVARGLPYLVAEDGGQVAGFAYAGPFRTRSAYRFTVEDSVYVAHDAIGRGIGRLLLTELIGKCAADGYRQMVALIGDSENRASIGLHRRLGFRDAGTLAAVGYKFDRWLDVVFMQRALGIGDRPG